VIVLEIDIHTDRRTGDSVSRRFC